MEAANYGKQEISETEMIRRSRAEELVMLMGHYPLELAVVALENCSDNLELAASWLLDNGARELDKFYDATLLNTLQNADANEEDAKDDEKEQVHRNIYDENGRINLMLWLNEEFDDMDKAKTSTSNLLDDEIDARLPIGLSLNEITAHNHNLRGREEEKKNDQQAASAE